MAKQLIIGNLIFRTKKAAIEHMKPILNGPPIHATLSGPDHTFLLDLLALHPDANAKIGKGVSHFTVEWNEYSQRGFQLHRVDGTSTDFSVYKCFDGKHNRKAQVQLALRTATMYQISRFRDHQFSMGTVVCPLSGQVLTSDTCHVDHESPATFDLLSQQWMLESGLDIETVTITNSADNNQGRTLTDPDQIASWQRFHLLHARLRLVSARANLSDAKLIHNRTFTPRSDE